MLPWPTAHRIVFDAATNLKAIAFPLALEVQVSVTLPTLLVLGTLAIGAQPRALMLKTLNAPRAFLAHLLTLGPAKSRR